MPFAYIVFGVCHSCPDYSHYISKKNRAIALKKIRKQKKKQSK